jgi:hypothetical protein
VGRALMVLPKAIQPALAPGGAEMLRFHAAFMRRAAAALAARTTVDRTGRIEALQAFEAVIEGLRTAGATKALKFEAAGPVFALAFAIESLHANLGDLADRADETALGRAETRLAD